MSGGQTREAIKFLAKCTILVMALATVAPAFALPPAGLSDSGQPGNVVIYPKFVNLPAVNVDGNVVPRTEIEIGAVCPAGIVCAEHQSVTVHFQWICPGTEGVNSNICPGSGFDVVLSVNGKLAFSADGIPINGNSPRVPAAPCPRGYLIGSASSDQPNFDGLIGNAVIRGPNLAAGPNAGSSTSLSAYQAITMQANTALTGVQVGDVRFDKTALGAPLPNVLSETFLVFLTLNVQSNRPNNPTFVPLNFYNESSGLPSSTDPNFENRLSTFWEFVCWDQVQLSTISPNLTQAFMGTLKGLVIAGPARKIQSGAPGDSTGPVTLIGLVETIEGTAANSFQERKYNFNMNSNGVPIP